MKPNFLPLSQGNFVLEWQHESDVKVLLENSCMEFQSAGRWSCAGKRTGGSSRRETVSLRYDRQLNIYRESTVTILCHKVVV